MTADIIHSKRRKTGLLSAMVGALMMAAPLAAQDIKLVEQHNSNALWFENWSGLSNANLAVREPSGQVLNFPSKKGSPVFYLEKSEGADGIYKYELRAATEEKARRVNKLYSGRDKEPESAAVPYTLTGFFVVSRGVIVEKDTSSEDDDKK